MGVGAAASEPGTLSVIRQLYPDRARAGPRARRVVGGVRPVARARPGDRRPAGRRSATGAAVFWFNLALGVVLLVAARAVRPEQLRPAAGPARRRRVRARRRRRSAALIYAGDLRRAVRLRAPGGSSRCSWSAALALRGVRRRSSAGCAHPMLDLQLPARPRGQRARCSSRSPCTSACSRSSSSPRSTSTSVVGYSGAQLAGVFAPMAVAIVRRRRWRPGGGWRARGSRRPMIAGCVLARGRASCVARRPADAPSPSFAALPLALALAGLGFGIAVVPLTSAVLGHVPGRPLGHGRVGHQHRPPARRGRRRRRARRDRQRHLTDDFGARPAARAAPTGGVERLHPRAARDRRQRRGAASTSRIRAESSSRSSTPRRRRSAPGCTSALLVVARR